MYAKKQKTTLYSVMQQKRKMNKIQFVLYSSADLKMAAGSLGRARDLHGHVLKAFRKVKTENPTRDGQNPMKRKVCLFFAGDETSPWRRGQQPNDRGDLTDPV